MPSVLGAIKELIRSQLLADTDLVEVHTGFVGDRTRYPHAELFFNSTGPVEKFVNATYDRPVEVVVRMHIKSGDQSQEDAELLSETVGNFYILGDSNYDALRTAGVVNIQLFEESTPINFRNDQSVIVDVHFEMTVRYVVT